MIYLKYIDPKGNTESYFSSVEELENYKAGEIEAVGYLVKEDDKDLYIAMQKNGKKFRKILFVPKTNITTRSDKDTHEGVKESVFTDVQLAFPTANATLEKLEALGRPSDIMTVGFVVRDTYKDMLLAMERNADGNFRTYIVFPKI